MHEVFSFNADGIGICDDELAIFLTTLLTPCNVTAPDPNGDVRYIGRKARITERL
jgi:hypothetical protein